MATGPGDEPEVAGRDRLRAGHADREQVIEALKAAFVQGRLAKDELDARVGQALAGPDLRRPGRPHRRHPARPGRSAVRAPARPGPPPAAGQGCRQVGYLPGRRGRRRVGCLDPRSGPPDRGPGSSGIGWCFILAWYAVLAALGFLGYGVATSREQRRSRRQLPPRPGGHALEAERRGGTGHGPVPPGPGDGQARASLRAHKPPQRLPARTGRAPRGAGPARGAPVPRTT
jgi:hypothetical protein